MIRSKATRCLNSLPTIPIRLFSSTATPSSTRSSSTNTNSTTIKTTTTTTFSSSSPEPKNNETQKLNQETPTKNPTIRETAKKTIAQLDEEVREKLEGRSGEGGVAGLEYEGGKAVAMKRGVRDNMFRYI